MTYESSGHLAEERIQAFLDDRLPADERAAAQGHLDRCVRCRAEVEAWRNVFARLDGMPELEPSPGFAEGVMEALPRRKPLATRVWSWLQGLLPAPRPLPDHLGGELVLAYLDRALPRRRRARVEAHLEECTACRREVADWRTLFRKLDGLERFSPAEGFQEAVLAGIRAPERAPAAGAGGQVLGWIERLRPRSPKGWAVAGAAAVAPVAAMAAGVAALFSNPLLTPGHLAAFLWWQVSAAVRTVAGGAMESVMGSPVLFQLWEAVRSYAVSPMLVGAGALAFSATTLAAAWVLYRNLISTPTMESGYANASV